MGTSRIAGRRRGIHQAKETSTSIPVTAVGSRVGVNQASLITLKKAEEQHDSREKKRIYTMIFDQ
jgi:hypothetical protein